MGFPSSDRACGECNAIEWAKERQKGVLRKTGNRRRRRVLTIEACRVSYICDEILHRALQDDKKVPVGFSVSSVSNLFLAHPVRIVEKLSRLLDRAIDLPYTYTVAVFGMGGRVRPELVLFFPFLHSGEIEPENARAKTFGFQT